MDRVRQWLKLDELLEKERQASLPWARSEGQKKGGGGGREAALSVKHLSHEMLVQEKEAMSRRAGVLNLMLHSTFNHELAMLMQQQQAALHAKKQNRFDYCLG
jgi:hypothetical protein